MKFSVIIPTYQKNEDLSKCLELLSSQIQNIDASKYEVIVSDDGISSTSLEMIQKSFPWVRWIAGPKKGAAANRNNGAKVANGNYFIFTDDDCLPSSGWLNAYIDAMVDNCSVYEGKTICNDVFKGPFMTSPVNELGGNLWSCNMMVKRETFEKLSGFDEGFRRNPDEDTDFNRRLRNAGYAVNFVEEAIIEHPAARRPWGRRSAALWEAKVRLWHKHGDLKRSDREWNKIEFAYVMFRARLSQLFAAPFNVDSILAFYYMPVEIVWAVRYLNTWNKRHRNSSNA